MEIVIQKTHIKEIHFLKSKNLYKKFISNFDIKFYNLYTTLCNPTLIRGGFKWEHSNEGYDYWHDYCIELDNIIKQNK